MLATPNKHVEIIYTTKLKTNPSNWAPLSPYEQMFLDPDCTIEIVHANEEVYKKLKNFRKKKSTNKFRSRNAIAKNHKIEVKEILDKIKKIKNIETELQILKVQMDERIKTADWVNFKVSIRVMRKFLQSSITSNSTTSIISPPHTVTHAPCQRRI